jgi:hypothetical protein
LWNSAQTYTTGDDWVFLAAAGIDGRAVTQRDIAPPIRRGGRLDRLFCQRWKAQTVHSIIKRMFGGDTPGGGSRLKQRQNP